MINMGKLHRSMFGHGLIVLLVGMLIGFGLLSSLLGGMEILPGSIVEFTIVGDPGAWARAHVGGMLNGMLIIVVAMMMVVLRLPSRIAVHLHWMLVGTGYANTVFYLAALMAPNRALSFADNRFGESNIYSLVGLMPALIFVLASIVAVSILIYAVFFRVELD